MEAVTWEPFKAALPYLVILALLFFSNHLRRHCRRVNLPPGPKPWPIIGNFDLIGPLPHRSIHELSKKYGPLMMLRFGSVPVLVGSSMEMAKLFLKTHDVAFSGRPKNAAGKYTTHNYSNITWSQYGPYLCQAQKLCLMELFNAKRLESYEYIRVEELNSMLKGMYEVHGKPILVKDHLLNLSLNVISRMVLGKNYLDDKDENSIVTSKEFKKMLDELFLLNGVFNLGDWIPCLKYLDVQGYVKRMIRFWVRNLIGLWIMFWMNIMKGGRKRRKIGCLRIWWMGEKRGRGGHDHMPIITNDQPNLQNGHNSIHKTTHKNSNILKLQSITMEKAKAHSNTWMKREREGES